MYKSYQTGTLTTAAPAADTFYFEGGRMTLGVAGGTWGGATLALEFNTTPNDGTTPTTGFATAADKDGTKAELTADGIVGVEMPACWVRAKLTTPGTGASVAFSMGRTGGVR